METQLTHLDQYKMLRDEIMYNIRELTQWQFAAAIAVGSIYTWFLLHKNEVTSPALWFIVPCILFFCAVRSLDLTIRIRIIATYLKRIEENTFGSNPDLPGWERYNAQRILRWYDRGMIILSGTAWLLFIALSIAVPWQFLN